MTMLFAGLDVHKKVVEAAVIDEEGKLLFRQTLPTTRADLETFAHSRLGPSCQVALEATTNTWGIVRAIRPLVESVTVSNPLKTRVIAEARVKTDRVDALVLAQLLRSGFLPSVWIPDDETERQRREASRRAGLVADCTRLKNRIHAILHQRLIGIPTGMRLFSARGQEWLEEIREAELDPQGRRELESYLRLLAAAESELEKISLTIARESAGDERVKLLMTLPGVDVAVGQALIATLGDFHRFRSGDHAASYLGIVPSTRQSAESCYHGPITKQGKGHTRWLMVQAAQHLDHHPGPLGVFFRRIQRKKNRNVAVVATARKLVVIAWHMLMNNEPYRYALPRSTQTKLARLRVVATGKRRRGGNPKGSGRSVNYGSGVRMRTIPALATVYEDEQLPPLQARKEGEERAISEAGVAEFVHDIAHAQVIPRKQKLDPEAS